MILTNTPSTTLDKVSLDIVGPFPTTKSLYTHDTRFAYQIFNGGAIQASDVIRDSRARRKVYQYRISRRKQIIDYRLEIIDYRLEFEFYKQRDALYNT